MPALGLKGKSYRQEEGWVPCLHLLPGHTSDPDNPTVIRNGARHTQGDCFLVKKEVRNLGVLVLIPFLSCVTLGKSLDFS